MRAFSIALLLPSVLGLVTPVHKRGTPISLPITRHYDAKGLSNIAEADLARVRSMIKNAEEGASKLNPRTPVPLMNAAVSYTISVGVGSPATNYSLVVDTGSSNTWVGAQTSNPYVVTSTSVDTGNKVSVSYGSGSFSGEEYNDTLTLSSDLVFTQSIGAASSATGFATLDGILGIGPTDLTDGTVANTGIIPTIVDSLFNQSLIDAELVGVYFQPVDGNNDPAGTGQLDLGDIDGENIVGDITYVPITSTSPASTFWGVDLSISSSVGDTVILSQTAGIVDTGTTLVQLASDAFQKYQDATGAVMDDSTGLLTVTKDQFEKLPSLLINLGGETLVFSADAQAWPQQLNTDIGGTAGKIYLIVSNMGSPSGQGLDFILGQTFLQRYYSVYDTTNSRVGLALTDHTFDITNVDIS